MTLRKTIDKILEWFLVFLMSVLVIDVLWQVFSRYILNDPSSYTDELAGRMINSDESVLYYLTLVQDRLIGVNHLLQIRIFTGHEHKRVPGEIVLIPFNGVVEASVISGIA